MLSNTLSIFLTLIIAIVLLNSTFADVPCVYRADGVCVCNETVCDSFNFVKPKGARNFKLVTSSKAGKRYHLSSGQMTSLPKSSFLSGFVSSMKSLFGSSATLTIDRTTQYQSMMGFGGAVTGTVQYLFNKVSGPLQNALLNSYFSSAGSDYSMLRASIGGSDFDLVEYAFDENYPGDTNLDHFTTSDPNWPKALSLVNLLNRIYEVKPKEEMKLFGAAWSPPKWMKTCNDWSGLCFLDAKYNQTWADYHLRYLRLMKDNNIDFYAISTGNEPSLCTAGALVNNQIMCLGWFPSDQGEWVNQHLGPTLRNSEMSNVKILAGDDQRFEMPTYFNSMNKGAPGVIDNFVDIFGVHWYHDDIFPASLLDSTHDAYPNQIILNSESCTGSGPFEVHSPILGSWDRAETYASRMIENFSHWSAGWIDWNLFLDESGGPTNIDNTVDAPIIINTDSLIEFYKQPMYYAIGHFSKFIPPGAVRIKSDMSVGLASINVETVAFLCPDGTVTVILHNKSNDNKNVALIDMERGYVQLSLDPNSVNTFVYA